MKAKDVQFQIQNGKPAEKINGKKSSKINVYSKDELKEFKEIILRKINVAENDYQYYLGAMKNCSENGTDSTARSFKGFEEGSNVETKESSAFFAKREYEHIISLKHALNRIENKTYGICRVTGKLIAKERLKIVPHATLSVEGKEFLEKQKTR